MKLVKNTSYCFGILLILLMSSSSILSQNLQLAGFSFTRFPSAAIQDSPVDQKVALNEYHFFINIPKSHENDRTIWVNGLQYKLVTPSADNDVTLGLDDETLHLIGYRLVWVQQLKNDWSLLTLLNPALSSTFSKSLESDDFLFNGTLQFIKEKSDRFSYGGGLLFTSRFGNPILLPTFQVTFKSEKSRFQTVLPRSITYDRYFGKLTVGLQASVDGSLYNVDYTLNDGTGILKPINKVAYTRVIAGPELSYPIGKFIRLEAAGGITMARSVLLESDFFEDQTRDVANGAFFQFGISILPPKK